MKKILLFLMLTSPAYAGTGTFSFGPGVGTITIASVTVSGGGGGGYSGYTYQSMLTISSANVAGNLSNFPVLVSSNNVALSTTTGSGGQLNSSGMDLIFSTMSDCSYALHWDTETIQNVGVSTMNAWVQIPTLTTSTLTAATFYMCWGNSGVTTYQGKSTATWDSNYGAVYHFANSVTLSTNDSTSNGNTLTTSGGQTAGVGIFGGAVSSVKTDTGLISQNNAGINQANPWTISVWAYDSGNTGSGGYNIVTDWGVGDTNYDIALMLTRYDSLYVGATYATSPAWIMSSWGSPGVWEYMTGTYDGTTIRIYGNGALQTSGDVALVNSNLPLNIAGNAGGTQGWDGKLTEMRFSSIARSPYWIQTEYNNQNSPSTFVTFH